MKVHTEIGYFVLHAWVTEGLAPGVVACSHHLGRWRVNQDEQIERMSSAWVDLKEVGKGQWKMRQLQSVSPYETSDPDTKRIWWGDAGVHQNITFPVHPDPVSGMHCWHQMAEWKKLDRTIVTATSSSTRTSLSRCINAGKRWRVPVRVPAACDVHCGFHAQSGLMNPRTTSKNSARCRYARHIHVSALISY